MTRASPHFEFDDAVAQEINAGRLWRAKEILQGRLSNGIFSAETMEAYGAVLLMMGDTKDAGRYLFVSGNRKPEYEPAITLFLEKFPEKDNPALISALPSAARRLASAEGAVMHTSAFRETGFAPGEAQRLEQASRELLSTPKPAESGDSFRDRLTRYLLIGLLIGPWILGAALALWWLLGPILKFFE